MVDAFADEMEARLAENRYKGGWGNETPGWLLGRLIHEMGILAHLLIEDGKTPIQIRGECADIANFAMMISDVAGGLKPKEGA